MRCIAGVFASLLLLVSAANASLVDLSTGDSQLETGELNQGWWSNVAVNGSGTNQPALTGFIGPDQHRGFFSFDVSAITDTSVVNSAKLRVVLGTSNSAGGSETINFFDVSTAASTLNNTTGTTFSIYNDLGTGNSYGSSSVSVPIGLVDSPSTVLEFELNAQAIADIQAAIANPALAGDDRFFSVGSSLGTTGALFGGTSPLASTLRLDITAVPEPSGLAVCGLLGCAGLYRRRRS